jgi:DNA-directed RNA polymerase subunit RPC12/RpoP
MSFEQDTTEEHERRITRCRYCHSRIIWFKTPHGNNPVDADTVEPEDEGLDPERHVSHRCPKARHV